MSNVPAASLRLKVDTAALTANWRALDAMSGSGTATGAAVKADCYGLGADICVPALRDAGAGAFFVAHWGEVPAIAAHVDPAKIAVLHGPGCTAEADYARSMGVVPVINSLHQAEIWNASGGGKCHLMVDTGINRLGINAAEVSENSVQSLDVDILMSHLACADEDVTMNDAQLHAFQSVLGLVTHNKASLSNSAGVALGPNYHFDMTRPGLSLYGGIARAELASRISQVAFPEAAIMQIRQIPAGDSIGYNATFTAQRDMRVGVVCLGYADGLLRSWAGNGALIKDGADCAILGKVSMDMIVVDLTNAPNAKEGDWLEVPYHPPEASAKSGLSQYELLTILGNRFQK